MNPSSSGGRYRGPTNVPAAAANTRNGYDGRNGIASPPFQSQGSTAPAAGGNTSASGGHVTRAERFEDEKRRIIESCFAKKDSDGSVQESYITHIQVTEDADYPSAPPPVENPVSSKPRVIMVAVRKSGRVRMHKGRQNNNGSFSIGKTWPLDDLSRIESFAHATAVTPEEQQKKRLAGDCGFIVTIGKSYYWRANTGKEKDFFILSLIKIYRKYTGGKLPELVGFSPQEIEQLGNAAAQAGSHSKAQSNGTAPGSSARIQSQEPAGRSMSRGGASNDTSRDRRRRPSEDRAQAETSAFSPSPPPDTQRTFHSSAASRDRSARPPINNDTFHSESSSVQHLGLKRSQSPPSARDASSGPRSQSGHRHFNSNQQDIEPAPLPLRSRTNTGQSHLNGDGTSRAPSSGRHDGVDDSRDMPKGLSIRTGPKSPFSEPPKTENNASSRFPSQEKAEDQSRFEQSLRADDSLTKSRSASRKPEDRGSAWTRAASNEPAAAAATMTGPDLSAPALSSEPPEESPASATPNDEPEYRPGLGPMIKKKGPGEVASKFRKAAIAYNAFKPRGGFAADKSPTEETTSGGGDGITGVFQAPSLLRGVSQDGKAAAKQDGRVSTPDMQKEIAPLNITPSPKAATTDTTKKGVSAAETPPLPPQDERRKKRRSDHSAKYAKALGISASLLEGRTYEIDTLLSDFGWAEESTKTTYEDVEFGIRKELMRLEAGSWLGAVESHDERAVAVSQLMDKVMVECEELDCLLTLYNVELGTLSEDVAYIEAQSQGLQVQTANQKVLQSELKTLLDNISINSSQLRALKEASLTKSRGIQEVESTLASLYNAMLTIDPKLRRNGSAGSADVETPQKGSGAAELSSMLAVREKQDSYQRECADFVRRLKQYLGLKFREAEADTLDAQSKSRGSRFGDMVKINDALRDRTKQGLWMYSPLILFTWLIEPYEWEEILKMYVNSARRPYLEEFKDNTAACKQNSRKPYGDESEVLFTSQEKEADSIVGRKLTVKRPKTIRPDGVSRISSGGTRDGKFTAHEAFEQALLEQAKMIRIEQNSIVELFHMTSLERVEYTDAIAADPESRQPGDLRRTKPMDPDREQARRLTSVMEDIFAFWPADLQSFSEWVVAQDVLNTVGVLYAIESQTSLVEESNQEYLAQTLSKLHDRLAAQFTRFIEEQIRGIEDTKVKINKRRGLISFMKTFPNFSAAIETMIPPNHGLDALPIRSMVDDAYQSINKSMFESLKFIAKEAPSQGHIATADPEDKEALNHHILLIENMNHFVEEVSLKENAVLQHWQDVARSEVNEHLSFYVSSIIRRPLGKLLDFVESTETIVNSHPSGPATSIALRPSHSRPVVKKILASYDAREIRRGVESLKKRVEKHFSEADVEHASKDLISKVLGECQSRYNALRDRLDKINREIYSGEMEPEFRKEDAVAAFRK